MKKLLYLTFLLLAHAGYGQPIISHTVCEDKAELTRVSLTNYGTLKIQQCVTSKLDGSDRLEYFTLMTVDGVGSPLSIGVINKNEAKTLSEAIRSILKKTESPSLNKGEDYTFTMQSISFRAKGALYGKWEYTIDPDQESFKGAVFKLNRKNMEELLTVISN